ncbi:MAG: hypothetical protein ACKVQW_09665 [Pyrinomonadaceae bacterium]
MKVCPRCQKTYSDDNLNFCLEDGSVLTQAAGQAMPDTVLLNQTRTTAQPQPPQAQPGVQGSWNVPPQQQYSMQPQKKSSKTWLWVLLILGGIVLLCGGGFGLLVYIGSQIDSNSNFANSVSNRSNSNKGALTANDTTTSTSDRTDAEVVDLSSMADDEFSSYGTTEFTNNELVVASRSKGYYFVLVAPENYQTDDVDTRLTLRNIDNAASSLGYGLIFHSNPQPLQQDYAFLIDTKRKRYRVVHHVPRDEKTVVKWTNSAAIKEGSVDNTIEVRDRADNMELYINGTMVTSIKNVYGYAGGVPGLYSGDGVKIAFKNLEIRK